jgi:hypothetical protein
LIAAGHGNGARAQPIRTPARLPKIRFSGEKPYDYEDGIVKAENHRKHSWTADHALNHIGGTMQPIQSTPKFSPFYVEFE